MIIMTKPIYPYHYGDQGGEINDYKLLLPVGACWVRFAQKVQIFPEVIEQLLELFLLWYFQCTKRNHTDPSRTQL